MKRRVLFSVLILAALALIAAACAAPPRHPARPVHQEFEAHLLRGVWFWQCHGGNPYKAFVQFLPNGTVRYDYNQGRHPDQFAYHNATWRIEGGRLIVDFNRGYAVDVYPLNMRRGDVLVGHPARTRPCREVLLRPYR